MTKVSPPKNNDKAIYIIMALILALVIAIGLFLFRNMETMHQAQLQFIGSKISELENRARSQHAIITKLKKQSHTTVQNSADPQLELKVNRVYNAMVNSPRIFMTMNQLKSTISRGLPFTNELNAMVNLLPSLEKSFEPIKPIASVGIINIDKLSQQLSEIAAKNKAIADGSWKGDILNKLNSLVEVNKTTDTLEAKINHINELLKSRNLPQAYAEAKKLNLPILDKWLQNLQNLILINTTFIIIDASLLRAMVLADTK